MRVRSLVLGVLVATACAVPLSGPRSLDATLFPDFRPESLPRRFEVGEGSPSIPVYGYVVSDSTMRPVSGAMIVLLGSGGGALSEPDGRYALWLPAGSHVLRIEQLGYAADSAIIELTSVATRADFALVEYPVSVGQR